MKYYYDIDHEKLYTKEQLYKEFDYLRTTEPENYSEPNSVLLDHCMTYNNGSIDVYSVQQFDNVELLESYVVGLCDDDDHECYILKYDDKRYIDMLTECVYEIA